MKRVLLTLLVSMMLTASAVAQVQTLNLPGRFVPSHPGAGVDCDAGACLGELVRTVSIDAQNRLVFSFQPSTPDGTIPVAQALTFTPTAGGTSDGFLSTVDFDDGTEVLTLTLSTGTVLTADLGAFTTVSEVATQITTALANYEVTTSGIADAAVTVAKMSSGSAADGQVATADGSGGVAFETLPTGGGGMGLSSVESNSTLEGDGTTGDPLGIADDGVDTDQLAADAVTQAKLANNSSRCTDRGQRSRLLGDCLGRGRYQ